MSASTHIHGAERRVLREQLAHDALRFAEAELGVRALTRAIHASRCASSPPCWATRSVAADDHCEACVRSSILRRERYLLKLRRGSRKETLLRRAAAVKGSTYGTSAGPSAGSGGVNRDPDNGGRPCIHPSTVTTSA